MPLQIGTFLKDRYQITEVIAKGGMGAVYRARDESLGIDMAIKENFFTSAEHARQFRREATLLAGLRHPNLPRVTDHFIIEGEGQYLVMDFIPGSDIRQLIAQQERLPELQVLDVGIAVCSALEYLHSRNPAIIHRDIKPGNVKITPGGQILLVDFGLAKLDQSGQATTVGAQGLTPGYAPPEQYGQGTEPRSDIYALGATLYAALTGKIPEDAMNRATGARPLVPIRAFNPNVSEHTAAVIERAMQIDPNARFQNAQEFAAALKSARSSLVPVSSAASIPQPYGAVPQQPLPTTAPSSGRRRSPALFIGAGVAALGLLAVILFFLVSPSPKGQPAASLAPTLPASSPVAAKVTDTPAVTPTDQPTEQPTAALPAGYSRGEGQIAFASDRNGLPQIYLLDTRSGDISLLISNVDGACQPAWSPDGTRLAFISPCQGKAEIYKNTSIYIATFSGDSLTNPVVRLVETVPGGDFNPAWSADGQKLAFTSLREGQKIVPFIYFRDLTANTTSRMPASARYDRHPSLAPDGNLYAVEAQNANGVYFINVRNPKEKAENPNAGERYLNNVSPSLMPDISPDGQYVYFVETPAERWLTRQGLTSGLPERLIEGKGFLYDPDVSPDCSFVVYEMDGDLYRVNVNSREITRLTTGSELDFQPSWRP